MLGCLAGPAGTTLQRPVGHASIHLATISVSAASREPAPSAAPSEEAPPEAAPLLTPAEQEAAAWLDGTNLVVWDFDMTLLSIHAFGEGVEPEEVAARWQADAADAELLRAFVRKARESGASACGDLSAHP